MASFYKFSTLLFIFLLCACKQQEAPPTDPDFSWVGSETCQSCHLDHHASWSKTYHRTMTQEANSKTVVGRFDGEVVNYWDQPIRPVKKDGAYYFEYLDKNSGEVVGRAEIKRTVGSHRYQQYLAQAPSTGENYIRMHLLWHIGEERWVHMNGAFLYSDEQTPDQHVGTWNHNCIFCHNTGPRPNIKNYDALMKRSVRGESLNFLREARYESEVSELGIACESCHGPAEAHADMMRNPLNRMRATVSDNFDTQIVNPEKLDFERSSQVCGQCHAQRQPVRTGLAEQWLRTGPTYRSGDNLFEHVDLVTQNTPGTAEKPDLYRLRFWEDGTPRLSAYEYTGLRQTPCHTEGQVSCIDCHEAHGGSPVGMITEANRRGDSCSDCHQSIANDAAAHTRHSPNAAVECVDCHMPRIVYGVMAIHRSHDIEKPQPLKHAAQNRPDACTQCHLDQSAEWAQSAISQARSDAQSVGEKQTDTPEWLKQLLGGDPVQRSIAAENAGEKKIAVNVEQQKWLIPPLLNSLQDDYPAVRRFAANSALEISKRDPALSAIHDALADYDFIAAPELRRKNERAAWRAWRKIVRERSPPQEYLWLQGGRVKPDVLNALRERARDQKQLIEIGE